MRLMDTPDEVTGPDQSRQSGRDSPSCELAEKVIALTGSKSDDRDAAAAPGRSQASASRTSRKARSCWDGSPKVKLETGLKKTIEYFAQRISA